MSVSVLEGFRESRGLLRGVASLIIFFFLFSFYSPSVHAVKLHVENYLEVQARLGAERSLEETTQVLNEFKAQVKAHRAALADHVQENSGVVRSILNVIGLNKKTADLSPVKGLFERLEEQHAKALSGFDDVRQHLLKHQVPSEILARHQEAVERFKAEHGKLGREVNALESASDLEEQLSALEAIEAQLEEQKVERTHTPADPDRLPWGVPSDQLREPLTNPKDLNDALGLLSFDPTQYLAGNGTSGTTFASLDRPGAEDLAETIEVQFSEAIKRLAAEQDHHPVKIYNWVLNNIEFIPSYGSIQGADYTLQSRKGNAFDTASLLIALLRAAKIPARYVYGTVEIPAEQVMNWVGGVEVPGAAQQLLGQGGIPNVGIIKGGDVSEIRMEHVWVEAWVDFEPSRAAKHVTGDSWIPLDASFKQYSFTQGQDLSDNVAFDMEGLADQVNQATTVHEDEGWVQGGGRVQIETALAAYQSQLQSYIDNQAPDLGIGDVVGTRKVIIQEFRELAAGLPYQLVARTSSYAALPDSLRHKFRYTLSTEHYGIENTRLITWVQSLPQLAGKRLALSFRPATQADEATLQSYMPAPDPTTGEVAANRIPKSLPGYLINLTAELTQDGTVVGSANAGIMGSELTETLALWSPERGWLQAVNHPVAGEYRAIGIDLQGVNLEELASLQSRMEATRALLQSATPAVLNDLNKHDVVGELLYATIYNYLILNDAQDRLQGHIAGLVNYRMPSFGLFATTLSTSYWYGMPRSVSFAGLTMDVDHLSTQAVAKDGNRERVSNFIRMAGIRASAMEHLVPEQFFSSETAPAHGVSAVKALALAAEEGQKIWTITRDNLGTALPHLQVGADIVTEIRNAVNAGKVATVHERALNYVGSSAIGYIILDAQTGAGAYKISTGANGGFLTAEQSNWLTAIGLGVGLAGLLFGAPILVFLSAVISLVLAYHSYLEFVSQIDGTKCEGSGAAELYAGLVIGAALLGFLFGGLGGLALTSWLGFFGGGAVAGSFLPKKGICH